MLYLEVIPRPPRSGRNDEQGAARQGLGLQAIGYRLPAEKLGGGEFAAERDDARGIAEHLLAEEIHLEACMAELGIGAPFRLVEIGQSDIPLQQAGIILRRHQMRRQADIEQSLPEDVAGMGVIGQRLLRGAAGRSAAQDQVQSLAQQIGDDHANLSNIAPRVTIAAAVARFQPSRSFRNTTEIPAPNRIAVSRKAATSATGALVIAHSTIE